MDNILEQLRSSFAASKYVQMHVELCRKIKAIEKLFKVASLSFESSPTDSFWRRVNSVGVLEFSQWSSLEPQAGKGTKSRSERDFYGLIPSQLEAEFESAAQSWASDSDGQGGSRWNEMDGTGVLACIALALANWDTYEQKKMAIAP